MVLRSISALVRLEEAGVAPTLFRAIDQARPHRRRHIGSHRRLVPGAVGWQCRRRTAWTCKIRNAWTCDESGIVGRSDPCQGAHSIITLVFRALLADEKGLHKVCMSKTASGLKHCVCCMNIIGRRRPDDIAGDWGIHFSQAGPDDFQLYDAASFARMLEEVRRVMEDPASKVKDKKEIQRCG